MAIQFLNTVAVDTNVLYVDTTNNRVGIGTTSPSRVLHIVDSSVAAIQLENSSEADSFIDFKNPSRTFRVGYDDSTDLFKVAVTNFNDNSLVVNSSGNVGIGTANPTRELEVKGAGNVYIKVTAQTDNDSAAIELSNTQEKWTIANSDTNDDALEFTSDTSGDSLVIKKTGEVGIGTSSPSNGKLQIHSTGNQISIETGTSGDGRLHIGHFTNGTFIGTYGDDGGAADIIRFGTHSGDERMRINSNGNVGIGTTSPDEKLEIAGDVKIQGADSGNAGVLHFGNDSDQVKIAGFDSGGSSVQNSLLFYTNTTERMRIGSAGQIGIGGANYGTSGQVLTSSGSGSAPSWQNAGAASSNWTLSGNDIYNNNSGNVGIGTTNPGGKLHVATPDPATNFIAIDFRNPNYGIYAKSNSISGRGNTLEFTATDYNSGGTVLTKDLLTLRPEGNVGIGTTSPTSKLNISGTGTGAAIDWSNTTATTGRSFRWVSLNSGGFAIEDLTASGANRLTIDSSGNSTFSGEITASNGTAGTINLGNSSYKIQGGTNFGDLRYTAPRHRFYEDTNLVMSIDGGNVGIGTTSPTNVLHAHSDTDNDYVARFEGSTNNTSGVWTGIGIGGESNNTKSAIIFEDIGVNYSRGKLHLAVNNEQNQNSATKADARLTVNNNGNVGIGITSPTNYKLEVNGSVRGDSFGTDQNTTARIFAPSGAAYNGNSNQTGYLIMQLPDNAAFGINNMMSGVIRVFDYAQSESFDVRFSGYWYAGYNWTNCTAYVINEPGVERNFRVSFGRSTGASGSQDRPYIAIGDATSVWTYCKFSVIEYTSGHSNVSLDRWNSGWAASLSSTLPGSVIATVSNTQTNNWKRASNNLYSGNSGNVGIGTTSPGNKLSVLGTGRVFNATSSNDEVVASITRSGSGAISTLGFNANGSTSDYHVRIGANTTSFVAYTSNVERMRINSSGNVGIGITNPAQKLHVSSSANANWTTTFQNTLNSNSHSVFTAYNNNSSNTRYGVYISGAGTTNSDYHLLVNSQFAVVGDGNVGIGTTSPAKKLHVYSDSNEGIFMQGTGSGHWFNFQSGTSNLWSMGAQAGLMGWYNRTTGNVGYKMVILDNGNVGIGTTSPSMKMHINGDTSAMTQVGISNTSTGGARIYFDASNGDFSGNDYFSIGQENDLNGIIDLAPSADLRIRTNGSERMRINSSGNVGIGTTSPNDMLEVYGSSPNIRVTNTVETDAGIVFNDAQAGTGQMAAIKFNSSDEKLKFFVNDETSQRMVIDTAGNVGIGTTSASARLDVYADGKAAIIRSTQNVGLEVQGGNNTTDIAIFKNSSGIERFSLNTNGNMVNLGMPSSSSANASLMYRADTGLIYRYSSSIRYKEDVKDLTNAVDKIMKLRPVEFKPKDSLKYTTGMIAEEVFEVMPEITFEAEIEGFDKPQVDGISYEPLHAYYIKAIQELSIKIEQLETRIQTLENN